MDLPLRRKDVWIVGSVCLISSPLLWRVLRSGMTQGGHRQAPAPEDTQVVLPLSTKTDPFFSCLNVFNQGAVLVRGEGVHAPDCPLSDTVVEAGATFRSFQHLHRLWGTSKQLFLGHVKVGDLFLPVEAKN